MGQCCGDLCGTVCAWTGCDCKEHDATADVKNEGRSCTDVIWIFVFVAMWVFGVSIFLVENEKGSASDLMFGTNINGELCDGAGDRASYAYYPSLSHATCDGECVGSIAALDPSNSDGGRVMMCADSRGCGITQDERYVVDSKEFESRTGLADVTQVTGDKPLGPLGTTNFKDKTWIRKNNRVMYRITGKDDWSSGTIKENYEAGDTEIKVLKDGATKEDLPTEEAIPDSVAEDANYLTQKNQGYYSEAVGYFCVPVMTGKESLPAVAIQIGDKAKQAAMQQSGIGQYISDVDRAQSLIIASIGIALVFCVLFMWIMKYFLRIFVYVGILLAILATGYSGYLCYDEWDRTANSEAQIWMYICWIGCAGITFLSYNMWESIKIALTIIEMSSVAVDDMWLTLLMPIPTVLASFGFLMFWVWGLVVLYSASTVEDQILTGDEATKFADIVSDGKYQMRIFDFGGDSHILWAHLFFGLWNLQTFNYIGYMVLAGAFADWYFSEWNDAHDAKLREEEVDEDHRLSQNPIYDSLYRIFRFHIGTLLLCSLIVAIVDFIRCVVYWVKKQVMQNACLYYVGVCVDCFLWMLRCCVDIISKNTMIYTAIWGTPFCASATCSFGLLLSNAAVAFAVQGFSWIIMLMGKFIVAAGVSVVGFLMIDGCNKDPLCTTFGEGEAGKISSVEFILFIIFGVSYLMACMTFSVYEVAIDTIFMGYMVAPELADESLQTICDENKLDENDPALKDVKDAHMGGGVETDEEAVKGGDDVSANAVPI